MKFNQKGESMKKILALTLATLTAGSVFAQSDAPAGNTNVGSEMNNMITFDADSVLNGSLNLTKSKTPRNSADNDTALKLNLNYFWASKWMQNLQYGGGLNYLKATNDAGDVENYGFDIGAIYNLSDDLTQSFYGKVLLGMDWNHKYSGKGQGDDEVFNTTFAFGKRFSLEHFGMRHLVYTPEIALTNANSTTGGNLEYSQAVELRFLQFAVFF